jgi:hypothetical protein
MASTAAISRAGMGAAERQTSLPAGGFEVVEHSLFAIGLDDQDSAHGAGLKPGAG